MKMERVLTVATQQSRGTSNPAETVAEYFRDLASRGMGCATNNHTIALCLGLSIAQVRGAKQELIQAKRLTGSWGVWLAIDGHKFSSAVDDVLDRVKAVLRKRYDLVCDARVVENPSRIPTGAPTHLIVGGRRMTVAEAISLSERLTSETERGN